VDPSLPRRHDGRDATERRFVDEGLYSWSSQVALNDPRRAHVDGGDRVGRPQRVHTLERGEMSEV